MSEDNGEAIMEYALDGDIGDPAPKKPNQSQRLEAVESAISMIADSMAKLVANQNAPRRMPLAESPDAIISRDPRDGSAQQRRRVEDFKNPRGPLDNYRPEDIVEPVAGSNFDKVLRQALNLGPEADAPLGRIICYMYTKRNGQPKYKVYFNGYGQDGCTQDELRLVS